MRMFNAFVDDSGQRWEFLYEESREATPGPIMDEPVFVTVVTNFVYRKAGDEEWLSLPPWATVRDGEKITLCLFDEDEETEELTFWSIRP